MGVRTPAVPLDRLVSIVERRNVLVEPEDLAKYAHDELGEP